MDNDDFEAEDVSEVELDTEVVQYNDEVMSTTTSSVIIKNVLAAMDKLQASDMVFVTRGSLTIYTTVIRR